MSNAGKSYQGRKLRDLQNFFLYCVDDEILKQLKIRNMAAISSWLGYPNTATYGEREKAYLEAEANCTKVTSLDTHSKNLIFDTTGSVIYLPSDATEWLKENCLIVNIDVGEDAIAEMLRRFIAEPKPVIWNGKFQVRPGESEKETIARCYPELLRDRLTRYRALAHITIPAQNQPF